MSNRRLVITDREDQIKDLDVLPAWDRSLIDYKRYHQYVGQSGIRYEMTMQGTRGCPFQCFYCDVQHITPYHRRRSIPHIMDELRALHDIGVRKCEFIDDAFNVDIKAFKDFFRCVIKAGLDMEFYFQSGLRGDMLDHEAIDLMVEGGTKSMNLSLESASPRLQKLMGKNLKIDKLYNNLQYIVSNYPNIILGLNAMHGFPTETEEEARSTVDFIMGIHWLHFAQLHNVHIFPNSKLERIALENGVTKAEIEESYTTPYHLIPKTIKLDHDFSRKLRLRFVHDYILNKERLKYVLGHEILVMNEEELKFKYQSIFPSQIRTIDDILRLARLERSEIDFSRMKKMEVPHIHYPEKVKKISTDAYRILFIDASQFFDSRQKGIELDIVEPPLGCMSILTYLNSVYNDRIMGEIIKTGVDVNSFEELNQYVENFCPDLIAIRTMTYFKDFFAQVVNSLMIVHGGGANIPIIAGGPHPTIAPEDVLKVEGVCACVIGEGEIICANLIKSVLENGKKFPSPEIMRGIKGLAFWDRTQALDND